MEIVDVTNWQEDMINPAGNRIKVWLIHPETKERYLFKEPKTDGEMIGEVASYYLGKDIFGLNIPKTSFAKKGMKLGSISKSFILEEEKKSIEFQEIVDYFGEDFDERDLNQYTLEKALQIVRELNCTDRFYEMLLFDFIIANQDRHAQNWGVLTNRLTETKTLSPLYDNGSSLFSGFSDERLKEYQRDKMRFNAYTNKAISLFFYKKKKPKAIDILSALYNKDRHLFIEVFESFSKVNEDQVYNLMKKIDLSDIRSKLIAQLICYRVNIVETLISRKEVD